MFREAMNAIATRVRGFSAAQRGCAYVAPGLLKVLEFAGKVAPSITLLTVLVGVMSWLSECPQRRANRINGDWSVVNSNGGGRRAALEDLYKRKVDLRGLYGEGGFFGSIDLHCAKLAWAKLNDSNFEAANLQHADLRDAHFQRARLTGANLTAANLTRANLCEAVLTGATLDHAVLTGADLGGSDLSRASGLTQMQVDAAGRGDWNTKLPAGIIAPKSWPVSPRLRVWFGGVIGPTETVCR